MDYQLVLARIGRTELLTQNWMKASSGDTTIRLAFQRGDRVIVSAYASALYVCACVWMFL